MKTSRRRTALGVASGAVIAAGLAAHAVGTPEAAAVSDALYAVLVYLLLGLVFVRARPWMLGVAAFGVSAVIELAQLTGLPERWSQAFPPLALVLGSTFSAWDLVAYGVGALVVTAVDTAVSARWRRAASRNSAP